jgi:hypothetical protein
LFINRADDRKFALGLAGTLIMAMIILLALAPAKVRARAADALARMGARRFSLIVAGPAGTSHPYSAASSVQNKNNEDGPAGSSFEVPAIWTAESWSAGTELTRAIFNGADNSGMDSFRLRPSRLGSAFEGWLSASDGWTDQQGSGTAPGGNTAGGQSAAGAPGGSLGGGISGGSGYPSAAPGGLTNSHDSASKGGLSFMVAKTISHSPHGAGASGNAALDSIGASNAPSDIKSLVTGGNSSSGDSTASDGSGLPDVLEAPSLGPGSGGNYQTGSGNGNGNGWIPGGDSGNTTYTGGGTTPPGNPGGSGTGHKHSGSGSTTGDFSGQNQNGPGNPPPVSDFSEISNLSDGGTVGQPNVFDGTQAVPEPSALMLFGTALLGIAASKLRAARKA